MTDDGAIERQACVVEFPLSKSSSAPFTAFYNGMDVMSFARSPSAGAPSGTVMGILSRKVVALSVAKRNWEEDRKGYYAHFGPLKVKSPHLYFTFGRNENWHCGHSDFFSFPPYWNST